MHGEARRLSFGTCAHTPSPSVTQSHTHSLTHSLVFKCSRPWQDLADAKNLLGTHRLRYVMIRSLGGQRTESNRQPWVLTQRVAPRGVGTPQNRALFSWGEGRGFQEETRRPPPLGSDLPRNPAPQPRPPHIFKRLQKQHRDTQTCAQCVAMMRIREYHRPWVRHPWGGTQARCCCAD